MGRFFRQLWVAITSDKYPSVHVWGYWEFEMKDGKVQYKHWATLWNFMRGKKTDH